MRIDLRAYCPLAGGTRGEIGRGNETTAGTTAGIGMTGERKHFALRLASFYVTRPFLQCLIESQTLRHLT